LLPVFSVKHFSIVTGKPYTREGPDNLQQLGKSEGRLFTFFFYFNKMSTKFPATKLVKLFFVLPPNQFFQFL
jgi:hypothetical protein